MKAKKEMDIETGVSFNYNDKEVIKEAKKLGVYNELKQPNKIVHISERGIYWVFRNFSKKGDKGYVYIRFDLSKVETSGLKLMWEVGLP